MAFEHPATSNGWHEDFEDEARPVEMFEDDGHLSSSWCEGCGLHWTDCDCPPAPADESPESPANSPPW